MGKRAVKTGRNLGPGVCSCELQAGPLGCVVPALLEGGDENILGTLHASSPCHVLGAVRGGLTPVDHPFWRRRRSNK